MKGIIFSVLLTSSIFSLAEPGYMSIEPEQRSTKVLEREIVFAGESIRTNVELEAGRAYVFQSQMPELSEEYERNSMQLFLSSTDGSELLAISRTRLYFYSEENQTLSLSTRIYSHKRGRVLIGIEEIPYGGHQEIQMQGPESWQTITGNMGETLSIYPSDPNKASTIILHLERQYGFTATYTIIDKNGNQDAIKEIGSDPAKIPEENSGYSSEESDIYLKLMPGEFAQLKLRAPGGLVVSQDLKPMEDEQISSQSVAGPVIPEDHISFQARLGNNGLFQLDFNLHEVSRRYDIYVQSLEDVELHLIGAGGDINAKNSQQLPSGTKQAEAGELTVHNSGSHGIAISSNTPNAEFTLFVPKSLAGTIRDAFDEKMSGGSTDDASEAETFIGELVVPEHLVPVEASIQANEMLSLELDLTDDYQYDFYIHSSLSLRPVLYYPYLNFSHGLGSGRSSRHHEGGNLEYVSLSVPDGKYKLNIKNLKAFEGGSFTIYVHPSLEQQVRSLLNNDSFDPRKSR